MIVSLNQQYKTKVDLDKRCLNSFCLISYANDFATSLLFSKREKQLMLTKMAEAANFDEILEIFKSNFGAYIDIFYGQEKI